LEPFALHMRCSQATVLSGSAMWVQGSRSSIWLRGWPATIGVMTSAR
jgi:hypothetical protein